MTEQDPNKGLRDASTTLVWVVVGVLIAVCGLPTFFCLMSGALGMTTGVGR
jgi:hypothetical protein